VAPRIEITLMQLPKAWTSQARGAIMAVLAVAG